MKKAAVILVFALLHLIASSKAATCDLDLDWKWVGPESSINSPGITVSKGGDVLVTATYATNSPTNGTGVLIYCVGKWQMDRPPTINYSPDLLGPVGSTSYIAEEGAVVDGGSAWIPIRYHATGRATVSGGGFSISAPYDDYSTKLLPVPLSGNFEIQPIWGGFEDGVAYFSLQPEGQGLNYIFARLRNGAIVSPEPFSSQRSAYAQALRKDTQGNYVLAGNVMGSATIGTNRVVASDGFVVTRQDSSERPFWVSQMRGVFRGLAVGAGAIFVASDDKLRSMDFSGDVIWEKPNPLSVFGAICAHPDGGFILAGGATGPFLRRYKANGDVAADYSNSGDSSDMISSVALSDDRHLTIAGTLTAPGRVGCVNLVAQGKAMLAAGFLMREPPAPLSVSVVAPAEGIVPYHTLGLDSVVFGTPPFSYQWLRRGVPLQAQTNLSLILPTASLADSDIYSLAVSNNAGSVTSAPVQLNVTTKFAISRQIGSQSVLPGESTTFSIEYTAGARPEFQWYHDGIPLGQSDRPTLRIEAATENDVGKYSVVLTLDGMSLTNFAILDVVIPLPEIRVLRKIPRSGTGGFHSPALVQPLLGNGLVTFGVASYPNYGQGSLVGWDLAGRTNWYSEYWSQFSTFYQLIPSATGGFFMGMNVSNMNQVFGRSFSGAGSRFLFAEMGRDQSVLNFRQIPFDAGVWDANFERDPSGVFFLSNQRLLALNSQGDVLAEGMTRFKLKGRAFSDRVYVRKSLAEFGIPYVYPDSWLVGKYSLTAEPEWVSEHLVARVGDPTLSPGDESVLVTFSTLTNRSFNSIVKGGLAWSFVSPIEAGEYFPLASGMIAGFFMATNGFRVGPFSVVPGEAGKHMVGFVIDAGGKIRCLSDFGKTMDEIPRSLTRSGPRTYWAVTDTSFYEIAIPEPTLDLPPPTEQIKTVEAGENLTLSFPFEFLGATTYRWLRNGEEIAGATSQQLELNDFSFAAAGQYSIKIRTAYASVTNRVATLGYSGPPKLIANIINGRLLLFWPISAEPVALQAARSVPGAFLNLTNAATANIAYRRMEYSASLDQAKAFYRLAPP
jgi:hypothetical protein